MRNLSNWHEAAAAPPHPFLHIIRKNFASHLARHIAHVDMINPARGKTYKRSTNE
jgi:hypothetical protein